MANPLTQARIKIQEMLEKEMAEVEPLAFQPLGSKEQRLARIELALLQNSWQMAAQLDRKLKPTK